MTRFRTLRGRLTALALLAALGAVVVPTIAFNLLLVRNLRGDADTRLRSRAAAAATTVVRRPGGDLRLRESPDDGAIDRQVWIYRGRTALQRPDAPRRLQRAADALVGRTHAFGQIGEDVRLYALGLTVRGRQIGTVVAGESLEAYDHTADAALVGSLALAAILMAAVGILTWVTVGRALDPVLEMTASAAEWSERDPGRRFGAVPRPDELGDLARTFDALLDRVAAALRHEQRLSAELSHELRTPLARIVAEVELLRRRERSPADRDEALVRIATSAEQMSAILETIMAAARAEGRADPGRAELRAVLARIAGTWEPALDARDVEIVVEGPSGPTQVGVDGDVVERIVAPLMDNAGRYARSRVVLRARPADGRIMVSVLDDGPGVAAEARGAVFEPGVSVGEVNGHGGAGLGLALARRLAQAVGGDVSLAPAGTSGAEFRVDLPA